MNRQLIVAASYAPRFETLGLKPFIVVPVVALVEGVIHASNAEHPELVTLEEFSRDVERWNGMPLYVNHPTDACGTPIRGNDPALIADRAVGHVRSPRIARDKLVMEAWIDADRCAALAPHVVLRAGRGEPIEVSVGVLPTTVAKSGTFKGKPYRGRWTNIRPDHLALLDGYAGACSIEMGCGVRAASEYEALAAFLRALAERAVPPAPAWTDLINR